jgi:hypothetical protein
LFVNGQSFSELKQTCLELTTLNIKLNPLKDGAITKGEIAYVLFGNENKLAEVFFPLKNKGIVLSKTAEGNWSNTDYKLIAWKGYVIKKNGIAIFGGD